MNYDTPICIKDLNGNEFWTLPKNHLASKTGYVKSIVCQKSFEEFVKIANLKYNNKFKYKCSNWIGLVKSNVEVCCPIHGWQTVNARSHISNKTITGCPLCGNIKRANSKTKDYDNCINQFKLVHGDKYIYPESNREKYINKKSKIKIICPIHGEFEKSAQKHLSGQGCHQCRIEELVKLDLLPGGYCEQLFLEKPELKNVSAILYYFEINNGECYKIGISRYNPKKRAKALINNAKSFGEKLNIKIINAANYTLYEAFQKEQLILNTFKEHRLYKKWSTEIFSINIYDKILNYF